MSKKRVWVCWWTSGYYKLATQDKKTGELKFIKITKQVAKALIDNGMDFERYDDE